MIKLRRKKAEWDYTPNVIPLIDISLILLVFFMITSNIAQHLYAVDLPKADQNFKNNKVAQKPAKITLFSNGTYALNEVKISSIVMLKQNLDALSRDSKILVISDGNAKVENIMSVLTFLNAEEFDSVDILVEQK